MREREETENKDWLRDGGREGRERAKETAKQKEERIVDDKIRGGRKERFCMLAPRLYAGQGWIKYGEERPKARRPRLREGSSK